MHKYEDGISIEKEGPLKEYKYFGKKILFKEKTLNANPYENDSIGSNPVERVARAPKSVQK